MSVLPNICSRPTWNWHVRYSKLLTQHCIVRYASQGGTCTCISVDMRMLLEPPCCHGNTFHSNTELCVYLHLTSSMTHRYNQIAASTLILCSAPVSQGECCPVLRVAKLLTMIRMTLACITRLGIVSKLDHLVFCVFCAVQLEFVSYQCVWRRTKVLRICRQDSLPMMCTSTACMPCA